MMIGRNSLNGVLSSTCSQHFGTWVKGYNCVYHCYIQGRKAYRVSIKAIAGWRQYALVSNLELAAYIANLAIVLESTSNPYELNNIAEYMANDAEHWIGRLEIEPITTARKKLPGFLELEQRASARLPTFLSQRAQLQQRIAEAESRSATEKAINRKRVEENLKHRAAEAWAKRKAEIENVSREIEARRVERSRAIRFG